MRNPCLSLVVFLLSSSLFVACTGNDEELKEKPVIPIQLGNFWKYQLTYHNENYGEDDPDFNTVTQRVVGPYTINGVDYFSMDFEYVNKYHEEEVEDNEWYFYGCDENGNMVSYGGISDLDTLINERGVILIKNSFHVGEVWESTDIYFENGDNDERIIKEGKTTLICISTDTVVSTPVGKFHCFAYDSEFDGDSFSRTFFSINVGLVRQERFEYGRLYVEKELIDYKVN